MLWAILVTYLWCNLTCARRWTFVGCYVTMLCKHFNFYKVKVFKVYSFSLCCIVCTPLRLFIPLLHIVHPEATQLVSTGICVIHSFYGLYVFVTPAFCYSVCASKYWHPQRSVVANKALGVFATTAWFVHTSLSDPFHSFVLNTFSCHLWIQGVYRIKITM